MKTIIYHFALTVVSRKTGANVCRKAAYNAGCRITDHSTGIAHNPRKKGGVVNTTLIAPKGHSQSLDREEVWNEIERMERRKKSRLAREFQITLPYGLSDADNWAILTEFAQFLADRFKTVIDVALHRHSRKGGDKRNIHGHVLMPTRRHDGEKFTTKIRRLDNYYHSPRIVFALRKKMAELTNRTLEKSGLEERVDHRSFETRGLKKKAQKRLSLRQYAMKQRLEADYCESEREYEDALKKYRQLLDRECMALSEKLTQAKFEMDTIIDLWKRGIAQPPPMSLVAARANGTLQLDAQTRAQFQDFISWHRSLPPEMRDPLSDEIDKVITVTLKMVDFLNRDRILAKLEKDAQQSLAPMEKQDDLQSPGGLS
ncbi:MobA/MobL family protein [Ereboglobus luteus]|uniref:MobA/MobL protein domain-containing protein n=1 Tax=Ereboglobus luteus TaxID=1796921 RepID=A0A2U8E1S5_9BACT|nr:MobA/MobL family protein [Ereboglobus luteus]AWI08736.1 hypothetical protein CKA38_05230 [Ereboglobus luteus]